LLHLHLFWYPPAGHEHRQILPAFIEYPAFEHPI
jgi:hypothetical protein